MAQQIFSLSQSFPAGTTTTPVYTAKPADHGVQGVVSAGPMADPETTVSAVVQVDRGDGNGWVDVGGVSGGGGLTGPKGGPYDQPVTITATTYCALSPGWKVRGVVTVANGPVAVSFAGNTF